MDQTCNYYAWFFGQGENDWNIPNLIFLKNKFYRRAGFDKLQMDLSCPYIVLVWTFDIVNIKTITLIQSHQSVIYNIINYCLQVSFVCSNKDELNIMHADVTGGLVHLNNRR